MVGVESVACLGQRYKREGVAMRVGTVSALIEEGLFEAGDDKDEHLYLQISLA